MNINRSDGWIKLHKKVMYSSVFQDENGWRLFSILLLMAHHEDNYASIRFRGKQRHLKAGQLSATRAELADFLDWPASRIRDTLYRLQADNQISIETDNHKTIISICNWSKYQLDSRQPNGRPDDNHPDDQTTTNRQPTSDKKNKEITNKELEYINTVSNSVVRTSKAVRTSKIGDDDRRLARLLMGEVYKHYPFMSQGKSQEKLVKNLTSAADAVNKLHRLDGYDYGTIEAVIVWSQRDAFWQQNIRSGLKLREKFDDLLVKIKSDVDKKAMSSKRHVKINDDEI